jgi:hypothetical protein
MARKKENLRNFGICAVSVLFCIINDREAIVSKAYLLRLFIIFYTLKGRERQVCYEIVKL